MKTKEEKLEAAKKKKYYTFTYSYTRYNPQLGVYQSTSDVIAATEKEAEKLAKISCDKSVYGSNYFDEITGKSGPLVLGEDYSLEVRQLKKDRYGYSTGPEVVVARKIYK